MLLALIIVLSISLRFSNFFFLKMVFYLMSRLKLMLCFV
jgi:hypothetical protein